MSASVRRLSEQAASSASAFEGRGRLGNKKTEDSAVSLVGLAQSPTSLLLSATLKAAVASARRNGVKSLLSSPTHSRSRREAAEEIWGGF